MAGVKQFDEDVVLDRVMKALWQDGYEATTMATLAKAAGIQRGSLYHAYGGKEALMQTALSRYAQDQGGKVRGGLDTDDPVAAMTAFLDAHIARMADPKNPPGCLMTEAAVSCANDPVVGPVVREAFMRTESALRDTLARAQAAGNLAPSEDPARLARFFLGVSRGMAVLHRAYGDTGPARDMAAEALRRLTPVGG